MSLVGSELNLVLDFTNMGNPEGDDNTPNMEATDAGKDDETDCFQDAKEGDNNSNTNNKKNNNDVDDPEEEDDDDYDVHPSPTPQTGMEQFFLGGLPTHTISAVALAEEIRNRHRPVIDVRSYSSASPEYRTAQTNLSDTVNYHNNKYSNQNRNNMALHVPRVVTPSTGTSNDNGPQQYSQTSPSHPTREMNSSLSSSASLPLLKEPSTTARTELEIDVAKKVYGTVKGVWGWGKTVIVLSPFLGLAEHIAGKVVETVIPNDDHNHDDDDNNNNNDEETTKMRQQPQHSEKCRRRSSESSSLERADQTVLSKLQELDAHILNPTIALLVHTVTGAAHHTTEHWIKPIVLTLLKPLHFMIPNEPTTTSLTPAEPQPLPSTIQTTTAQ